MPVGGEAEKRHQTKVGLKPKSKSKHSRQCKGQPNPEENEAMIIAAAKESFHKEKEAGTWKSEVEGKQSQNMSGEEQIKKWKVSQIKSCSEKA